MRQHLYSLFSHYVGTGQRFCPNRHRSLKRHSTKHGVVRVGPTTTILKKDLQ